MAAQKLTKGRFIQIIIMLTLLVVAFFWRTYTYDMSKKVTCDLQQSCSFYVNGTEFIAAKTADNIEIVTSNSDWEIQTEAVNSKANNSWQVQLVNIKSKESYKRELIFSNKE